jgi:hypothetical protein
MIPEVRSAAESDLRASGQHHLGLALPFGGQRRLLNVERLRELMSTFPPIGMSTVAIRNDGLTSIRDCRKAVTSRDASSAPQAERSHRRRTPQN